MSVKRYPIQDRWSYQVAERGFSAVPSTFLDAYADLGIKPTEAMLLIHLMSYKWDERMPFPSVRSLRKKLGLSDSQVRAILRTLEKKKLIQRRKRTGRSNVFDTSGLIAGLEKWLQNREAEEAQMLRSEADQGGAEEVEDWDEE